MSSTNAMLRLSTFCFLLAVTFAQSGYEYNKPGKPFSSPGFPSQAPSSPSLPGPSASGPTSNSISGQTGSGYAGQGQNYPGQTGQSGSSPTYSGQGQNYPGQPGQSGSSAYPGQEQNYPGQPSATGAGPSYTGQNYPGQSAQPSSPGQPGAPGFNPASAYRPSGSEDTGAYEGGDYSAIPGEPDKDYPILTEIPKTAFRCDAQAYPGYYADVEARCQVYHVCANNITYDFLCPNGTIFSQEVFVCVWWNQFDCNSAPNFYELNANLYDYSQTGSSIQGGEGGGFNDYSQGAQGSYRPPGATTLQGSYPGSSGPQGPSVGYPSSTAQQQTSQGSYPTSGQGSSAAYPGSTGSQPSYPGSTGPSASYPGSSVSPGYAAPSGPQSPVSQGVSSYPGSRPESQGYPSGKPSGASFPTGGNGGRPRGDTGFPAQQPNREYLPPN